MHFLLSQILNGSVVWLPKKWIRTMVVSVSACFVMNIPEAFSNKNCHVEPCLTSPNFQWGELA